MRKAIFLFITLLTAFSACTKRSEEAIHRLLKQADEWAYASPDTVLHLLKELTEKDLQNKDDYYYYYLLGAEACMKKHYTSYDTLAIGRTARHYEKGGDRKMLARAYRLWGYAYRSIQGPHCYAYLDKSIGYARQAGDKRLLADIYLYASAGFHVKAMADGSSLILKKADSLYREAERMAWELKDTLFLLETWQQGSSERFNRREYQSAERLMLKGLAMAESFGHKGYEAKFTMELSWLYGNFIWGEKEKSLYYAKRNLAAREGELDEWMYHLNLSSAYQRIGQRDSADYHQQQAKKFEKPEHNRPDFELIRMNWEDEGKDGMFHYLLLIGLVLLGATTGFVFLRRKHLRKLSMMQRELDILTPQAPSVFDKMDRIVKDHLYKDRSELHMEEADWRQLQLETDKHWNGITFRLQKKYRLTDMEIRLFCLNLTEIPTMHMPYLFDRGRSTIYNKNRELLSKLKIERTSNTFKEDLKAFIEKEK